MPIDYSKYHPEWETQIRPDILKRANNCCEKCLVKNYDTGFRTTEGIFYNDNFISQQLELHGIDLFEQIPTKNKRIKIVLTIAHLDHNIENNDYSNLMALCQRCHLNHDRQTNITKRKNNPNQLQINLK